MKLLIFDTETTGLPVNRVRAQLRPMNWPHIVSISWIVLDSKTNSTITKKSYIIKPIDWIIPIESTNIHGIQHAFASNYGVPLRDVMNEFISTEYDMVVAHNLEFDENVVVNALYWDLGCKDFIGFTKPKACTMLKTTKICKLPSNYGSGYKPPKLSELYEYVFKRKPILSRLHGSYYDTKILCDVIKSCKELRELLGLDTVHEEQTNVIPNLKGNILIL